MAAIDVSSQRKSLLDDATVIQQLPPELLDIVLDETSPEFLDAVAAAALISGLTGRIFIHFESCFADISARWIVNQPTLQTSGLIDERVVQAFAGILPFAPNLSVFLENYLWAGNGASPSRGRTSGVWSLIQNKTQDVSQANSLLQTLLAVWRLISFDTKTYSQLVVPSQLPSLFNHESTAVRYIAIRIFCQLLGAADFKLEALIRPHVPGEEPILGAFDGREIDYRFLTLFEHARARDLCTLRREVNERQSEAVVSSLPLQVLSSLVVQYGKVLLPRPSGAASKSSSLVLTPTTLTNLECLAKLLQKPGPNLIHGLPGSGKTSLVREAARELGYDSGLVTLHLNEQTDAKMLIGLYTTDTKPGSFTWRAGILTTAVREGRWVLIEDLDRAPNEVMSTLLPLVERGELLIPSRGETIRAPSSFRIFATMRTTLGMNGEEHVPSLLGLRFWQLLPVQSLPQDELRDIIYGTYPLLHNLVPGVLSVYEQLCALLRSPSSVAAGRGGLQRQLNPRDLLKWCRRLNQILVSAGCKTGDEPLNEAVLDWMFMEAIDCLVGSVKEAPVRDALIYEIGQEMRLPRERVEHYLTTHIPQLEDNETQLKIGRTVLPKKKKVSKITKPRRPFATTLHARRLLEQISVAVKLKEPTLLVGETGIGKTTVVQQLADSLGHRLIAVNLSQQSEVGDLLGGFKPVNVRSLAVPLKEEFEDLFSATGISTERNQKYLDRVGKSIARGKWSEVSKLWGQAPKMFDEIVEKLSEKRSQKAQDDGQPAKRRKTESSKLEALLDLRPRWEAFSRSLDQFEVQISGGSGTFAFAFVEGNIVKAVRNGDWVLLDEINLASPDTLESIADLLQSGPDDVPSILLSETGQIERIRAHPDFRIFGAMNPATDVGKRDLPLGLRSRFTEIYVASPDRDLKDLVTIIKTYLRGNSAAIDQAADKIANLYLTIKRLAEEKAIVDGANEVPHFSLRTLTRVLTYVNDVSPFYGLDRALFEGFCMGFLTLLDQKSENVVMPLLLDRLFGKTLNRRQSLLSQPPKYPSDGKEYVRFMNKDHDRQYWLLKGQQEPIERPDYIRTKYVERNLLNLVRATSTRRFPILIQGPTSAGKTSMIEYLAHYSGNKFVRINNHEHTDLQEYLGTYVSGSDGKLMFQEGLLVQAMRRGHWIVLDELNLAPTDVLEALNRLLDDNRELLIPETQEVVRPHEGFMLFATQNPPGLYGGRKVLSRAFRNRFLELHYDDIPEDELEYILQKRSINTSPSDCKRIVSVYKELSRLRQTSRVFEQSDSFATLRDLFRWALRDAADREQIANNGFMLLAERVRNEEERIAVKEVIETVFKVKINPDILYSLDYSAGLREVQSRQNSQGVVWTKAMRRLYVLVAQALRNNEPVLLVGETGCGKTTVCQVLAEAVSKELHIVNAHQNTETGDLIGSQRPVRNRGAILDSLRNDLRQACHLTDNTDADGVEILLARYHALQAEEIASIPVVLRERISANEVRSRALFEWCDGSLVHAMKTGQFFLLDEISLADDSVLERLNSVLEPQRTVLLAEKGAADSFVQAAEGFQFFATMNPGGDFGKKELSPALRNRFTEIWVPPLTESQDVLDIVQDKLIDELKPLARIVVDFSYWFGKTFRSTSATAFSIRDILVWAKFINQCSSQSPAFALLHGAATVFIDTLGANPSALLAIDPKTMEEQRQKCLNKLNELIGGGANVISIYKDEPQLHVDGTKLTIGEFGVARATSESLTTEFEFEAPTTKMNAMRVIRALQIQKPILLEGNPGVGKTTLVSALARACGIPLTRINLSDQTDLMDLFGTDVPVEGSGAGNFAWRNAPFLQAMQKGEWVLLDEMNLASQSVLEGLNACLDHRGEVYISELDQVFKRHPDFRLFAAQNPHHQGGGRKGLPSSFVNRFVVVYADVFIEQDLMLIAGRRYPTTPSEIISQLIQFISTLDEKVALDKAFGSQGAPWEFNLRDTLRWLELLASPDPLISTGTPKDFLDIVIRQRFRTDIDRQEVSRLFSQAFRSQTDQHSLYHSLSPSFAQVGLGLLQRNLLAQPTQLPSLEPISRLPEVESLMICINHNLPCIIVGPSGSGKSVLLSHLAALAGKALVVFPLNADVDTMDLVGGFEQADPLRELHACLDELRECLRLHILSLLPQEASSGAVDLLDIIDGYNKGGVDVSDLLSGVEAAAPEISAASKLGVVLSRAFDLLQRPLTLENPSFEWLDGIIVKAMQNGQWLVLDNANLCSASVLDRLNSLLERPDGFLSINEHSGLEGEPRIIRPHADFRIFLTMDPRYGELSRAMRNRSVEIYLNSPGSQIEPHMLRLPAVESSLQRYYELTKLLSRNLCSDGEAQRKIVSLAIDNISLADTSVFSGYAQALGQGLLSPKELQRAVTGIFSPHMLSYIQSEDASRIREAIFGLYSRLSSDNGDDYSVNGRDAISISKSSIWMQPMHPLNNGPVVHILDRFSQGLPFSLATCYEYYFEILSAQEAMRAEVQKANATRPSSLNRFQRSCVADKVAVVAKDSTVRVAQFLSLTLEEVTMFLRDHLADAESWKQQKKLLRIAMHYWWRTFNFASSSTFDEAIFQAHINQGRALLQDSTAAPGVSSDMCRIPLGFLQRLDEDFVGGFKLTTGLSMELLWNLFRPLPIPDESALHQAVEMETLAARFDALKWKVRAAKPDLARVMVTLAKAYGAIRIQGLNAKDLVRDLSTEIEALESKALEQAREISPYLAGEFEVLREVAVLELLANQADTLEVSMEAAVLADVSTLSRMRLESSQGPSRILQSIAYLLGSRSKIRPWSDVVSSSLLGKYDAIGSASLLSLASLEDELPLMGKIIASSTKAITADPLIKLTQILLGLLSQVVAAHDASLADQLSLFYRVAVEQLRPSSLYITANGLSIPAKLTETTLSGPAHLLNVARKHLLPSVVAMAACAKGLEPRRSFLSIAWVQFAVGCVKLYIPDKIFDPYLRAQMERDFHVGLREGLERDIQVICDFEKLFTGQSSNLRSRLLEDELAAMGELPAAVQQIYRPLGKELASVQGEFNNVLDTILRNDVSSMHFKAASGTVLDAQLELDLVRDNVAHLIDRLSNRFNAYQDITVPLVNILHCLEIGLSLTLDPVANSPQASLCGPLLRLVPLLGGTMDHFEDNLRPIQSFEFLTFVGTFVSVEGIQGLSPSLRQPLFASFQFYYEEWAKKLEADRKLEEAKSSIYRFKGSFEDEEDANEEEFLELFPDYDAKEKVDAQFKKQHTVRDLSDKLANVHKHIFLDRQVSQSSLQQLCKVVGRRAAKEVRQLASMDSRLDKTLLPATMLVLDEKLAEFKSASLAQQYNFYADANLAEVLKFNSLANEILLKFRDLQAVDEIGHLQPIADVIAACDYVFELGHSEPLAKIIVKAEKLHESVYEWEFGGYASQKYSARSLYDRLTRTIIDWRRFELSTWGKLFDMELSNCEKDANSWWFIAYQAVIVGPLSIIHSDVEGLKQHTTSLLKELGSYLDNCIVGQFSSRLNLLRQLREHLKVLALDYPAVSVVHAAVTNFISFYARFEKKAVEVIQTGRNSLDKSMKDVLLMASWKDTNISALRDSARRSHMKLFRLVRKFRNILGQHMMQVFAQGLPDEEYASQNGVARISGPTLEFDPAALTTCQREIPDWGQDAHSKRLLNIENIVGIMDKKCQLPTDSLPAAETLDNFVTDILSSMAALRKETPPFLTEENKDLVKNLKIRKTELFNDTLKAIRQMGVVQNLSEDRLACQKSKHEVLSLADNFVASPAFDMAATEYYFHKMLDLAPRFREAMHEHSGDLSRETVKRSTGYLEGIFFAILQQRAQLSRSMQSFASLDAAIAHVKNIKANQQDEQVSVEHHHSNWPRVLSWLVPVLEFTVRLVEVHARLGGIDNTKIQASLESGIAKFNKLKRQMDSLPALPNGLVSSAQQNLRAAFVEELELLRSDLNELAVSRPDLSFIMEQAQLWTRVRRLDGEVSYEESGFATFYERILSLFGKTLDAAQKFNKAAATMPTSIEDARWLIRYDTNLSAALNALRIETIGGEVNDCIELFKKLSTHNDKVLQCSRSLLAVLFPVLQQYSGIAHRIISQFAGLHQSTCRMGYHLSNSFALVAKQGFCTPQEKSDEKSDESGKLESGTGLGDGEGAEDISKDIQPDEDLSELAQQENKQDGEKELEDEKDAVDMGEDDLEGEMGSTKAEDDEKEGSDSGEDDEGENEMDEEAGEVDDLDPTAVDEKMWDGKDEEEAEKDQKGNKPMGQKKEDEQVAADEDMGKDDDVKPEEGGEQPDQDMDEEAGPEQEDEEVLPQDDANRQDQNVQENEALELPGDMEIDDGDEGSDTGSEDDLDNLSNMEEDGPEQDQAADESDDGDSRDAGEAGEMRPDEGDPEMEEIGEEETESVGKNDTPDEEAQDQEDGAEAQEEEDKTKPHEQSEDKANADSENSAPSDVQTGAGQEQDTMQGEDNDNTQSNAAQRDHGDMGENAADQQTAAGNKGSMTRREENAAEAETDDAIESSTAQPFKKLGDALEKWYRNQQEIKQAPVDQEAQPQHNPESSEAEAERKEFQHLQDEHAEADAQALGGATDEEVKPIDDSMAIDNENEHEGQSHVLPEDAEEEQDALPVDQMMDVSEPPEAQAKGQAERDDGRSGAATRQGNFNRDDSLGPEEDQQAYEDEEKIEETSTQLSGTHITQEVVALRDYTECLGQWTAFQTKTQTSSLSLTSQLRLILTPSQTTKLSGSFRTGKRLNIKKIIPYIASSYKRDKIWMRRSVPTKRAYQILLCVDDSRSMGGKGESCSGSGSGAGSLALESLVMVSRALTMLEVGQVGVLGFGADVFTAHELSEPFASHDAGARVLQRFSFAQDRTDVALLIRRTIDRFRAARAAPGTSSSSEDLWQLALIMSDGLTPSSAHERIRRLLREAMEERIMIVFIIMDDPGSGSGGNKEGGSMRKGGDSVLELKEAKFVKDESGNSRVVIERYLDTFPFQYYLIVHNLEDLPGALAGLLRTWFAEVNA